MTRAPSPTRRWATVADIRSRVRRRWDDGTLLRAVAAGDPFPSIEVPLRGPRAADIGDDLEAVRAWMAALDAGRHRDSHYSLVYAPIGGRHIGRNELPSRAIVATYDQAWSLLGVALEVARYELILAETAVEPVIQHWVMAHPLRALALGSAWPGMLSAYRWLIAERGSGRYLRQISAPGVDTKFVEQHRAVLAQLLGVPSSASGFLDGVGLRAKPETVRLRVDPKLGLLPGFSEAALRVAELASADLQVSTAVIVENEVTYLSVPVPAGGVVLWGKGFEVSRAGSLPWLRNAKIHYWGDLDTHGFAILHQLRAWLPDAQSFLMDRATLDEHRDRWVREPAPTTARLDRLTGTESTLYADLVADHFGDAVRLEQERIDWTWALDRLPYPQRR